MNRTAIHEAGHVLMAQQCGLETVRVQIIDENEGSCEFSGTHTFMDAWRIALAGPVAERYMFGNPDDCLISEHGGAYDLYSMGDINVCSYVTLERSVTLWAEHYAADIEALAGVYA